MSSKDLAIFESRLSNWEVTHPRLWATSVDAAPFISSHSNRIAIAQLKAADRIVVSQERIKSGIDKVAFGIDRVAGGLESLASAFEWGFSELVWQLEQQREILKKILEVLQAPLDTQAKELRRRAEDAYKNGWIDDALEDFLESEKKNRYDFAIHISLGHIYFFEKRNPETALEYYKKAVKYAIPKSPYHASFALLHIGLTKYLQGNIKEAYEAALKAIELSPDMYEAYFQCAQYCANLGKYDDAITHLSKAIDGDRYYCVKVYSEKDFDVMTEQLQSFFKELLNKVKSNAKSAIEKTQEMIKDAKSCGVESDKFRLAIKEFNETKIFMERGSLLDCLDVFPKAYNAQRLVSDSSLEYLRDQIVKTQEDFKTKEYNLRQKKPSLLGGIIAGIIGIIIGVVTYHLIDHNPDFLDIFAGSMYSLGIGSGFFLLGYYFKVGIRKLNYSAKIKNLENTYNNKIAELKSRLLDAQTKRSRLGIEEYIEKT